MRVLFCLFLFFSCVLQVSASTYLASHYRANHDSPERDTAGFVLCSSLVTQNSAWDVDELGNIIVVEANQLKKYDSNGNVLFTQSIKTVGKIDKIDARNPMKIMFFSEDQQLIGILDNSLTFQGESIDLNTFGLNYVQAFSASFQNNKFWVYDQENSKLALLSTNNQQNSIIENLKSLLGFNEVTQIIEESNFLYLFDKTKGVYKLDNYGNLVDFIAILHGSYFSVEKDVVYITVEKKLRAYSYNSNEVMELSLPSSEITQFKKQGAFFYFLEKNKLSKFSFQK